ncbi:MAG: diacylglycerol kinase [Methyloprofundus sp.]|nr:diacylglycerol kinase [Methyloprofundus sp.]
MANQNAKGIKRLVNACFFSIAGLKATWQHEEAFRQEIFLACVGVPAAFYLTVDSVERVLLISSLVMILIVELLNSAIEAVVDRVGTEHHELSGRAKDIGSAAVMLTMIMAGITWLIILI